MYIYIFIYTYIHIYIYTYVKNLYKINEMRTCVHVQYFAYKQHTAHRYSTQYTYIMHTMRTQHIRITQENLTNSLKNIENP